MADPSFYVVQDERDDLEGGRAYEATAASTEHTVGPWAADLQHAGPPAALLVHAVSRLGGREAPAPPRALPARVTAEILHPVPVADVEVRARLVRPGRRVALAHAELVPVDGPREPVMTASVWLVRRDEVRSLPSTPRLPAPGRGEEHPPPDDWVGGYLHAVRWEMARGSFEGPGAATAWTRIRVPLLDTRPTSGVERALVVADAGSGLSSVASPAEMVFVNTELTVHLVREPVGEDVWMDSVTALDPSGIGHAHTVLGDTDGSVGMADQTLFVAPR